MFVHCLDHFFLVVVQLKGDKPPVHRDYLHVVLGKVYRIEHAFLDFVQMPLRQSDRNVFPLQKGIAVERAVRDYGCGDGSCC